MLIHMPGDSRVCAGHGVCGGKAGLPGSARWPRTPVAPVFPGGIQPVRGAAASSHCISPSVSHTRHLHTDFQGTQWFVRLVLRDGEPNCRGARGVSQL